jgi:transcriptional regulator GlxA family with amidase domain
LRLPRARELLLTTDLLIKEICFQAGIPNGPNFDREFKKHFKAPPSPVPGAISQSI